MQEFHIGGQIQNTYYYLPAVAGVGMKVLNIYISSTIEDSLENRVSAPLPLPALHRKGEYNQIECFYIDIIYLCMGKKYEAKKWIFMSN